MRAPVLVRLPENFVYVRASDARLFGDQLPIKTGLTAVFALGMRASFRRAIARIDLRTGVAVQIITAKWTDQSTGRTNPPIIMGLWACVSTLQSRTNWWNSSESIVAALRPSQTEMRVYSALNRIYIRIYSLPVIAVAPPLSPASPLCALPA
jgi:hypothetical protein